MFSRYKKPSAKSAAPAAAVAEAEAPAATKAPAPQQPRVQASVPPAMPPRNPRAKPAEVTPQDREKKRKERLGDIKLEMHRVLLDKVQVQGLISSAFW